jgi:hypothetical protein
MIHRKLITFLIILILVNLAWQAAGQDVTRLYISGIGQRTSLEEYMERICTEYQCRFYYQEGLLDEIYIYPTDNGKEFLKFLDVTLAQHGITYIVYRNRNIVFVERSRLGLHNYGKIAETGDNGNIYASVDIGDPLLSGKFRKAELSGYIRNGKTGEPLPGAVIYLEDLDLGVVTDQAGYYKTEIPVGRHPAKFS